MNDYSEALDRILSDPAAMEQIKALGSMLMSSPEPAPPPSAPPMAPVAVSSAGAEGAANWSGGGDLMQTVIKMAPLLGRFQEENDSTRLLFALRPFLSPVRQERLDRAVRMLRLFRLLPALREMGGSLF